MWFRFPTKPVMNTITVCMTMKNTIQAMTPKWTVRATWRLSSPRPVPSLAAIDGACSSPVTNASGAATNTVRKYAMSWRPL